MVMAAMVVMATAVKVDTADMAMGVMEATEATIPTTQREVSTKADIDNPALKTDFFVINFIVCDD